VTQEHFMYIHTCTCISQICIFSHGKKHIVVLNKYANVIVLS